MNPITIYTANRRGDKYNTYYPDKRIIASVEDLTEAAQYDQVFAEYSENHRGNDDFIRSDFSTLGSSSSEISML